MEEIIVTIIVFSIIISIVFVILFRSNTYDKAYFYISSQTDLIEKYAYDAIYARNDSKILFVPFETMPTKTELEERLEFAYNKGIRKFFGFIRTSMLTNVIDFATIHPEAMFYSSGSVANSLSTKPSNVFRYIMPNDVIERCILSYMNESGFTKLAIIYDTNDIYSNDIYYGLKFQASENGITTIDIPTDLTNISIETELQGLDVSDTLVAIFAILTGTEQIISETRSFWETNKFKVIAGNSASNLTFNDSTIKDLLVTLNFGVADPSARYYASYEEADFRTFTAATLDILDYLNGSLRNINFSTNGDKKYGQINIESLQSDGTYETTFIYEELGDKSNSSFSV